MINFTADHYFHIGRTHLNSGKPCQDFALSGISHESAFAIVSDGCSKGGMTDVGSRVLALATAQALRRQSAPVTPTHIAAAQQLTLETARTLLGVNGRDMLATCVYALLSQEGGLVHLQGDGVIAYQTRDGIITMIRYDWQDNAPCYPAYASNDYADFLRFHGGDLSAPRLTRQECQYTPGKGYSEPQESSISLGDGIKGVTITMGHPQWANELEYLGVFTDGVTQFGNQDWRDVVRELLAFKATAGEFVKRRMNAAIKAADKSGNTPMDDVGAAIIHVQPPGKEDAS